MVGQKGGQPLVGQGVFDQLPDDVKRYGGDIGPQEGAFEHVLGRAHAGHDDFRLKAVMAVDGHDFRDQFHSVLARVVQAADKGADEGGAGLGGQNGLEGREDQGQVDLETLGGQDPGGGQAVQGQGQLDGHVVGQAGQAAAFQEHTFPVRGQDFGADRAFRQGADGFYVGVLFA